MAKRRKASSHIRRRKLLEAAITRSKSEDVELYDTVAEEIINSLTVVQKKFVLDPDTQKAALCSRRAGKTHACKIALLYTALTQPGSSSIYINTSRGECRDIIWKGMDGIKQLCKKYGLLPTKAQVKAGAEQLVKANEQYLELEFSNGSYIRLIGVDDSSEMEKRRGNAYDLVVIDESAKVDSLQYFVEDILMATLADRLGTIALIGTPSATCTGFFHAVTKENPTEEGWSVHKWTHYENTAMPHFIEYFLKVKEKNNWADDNPTWLRENCAIWVKSTDLLVYSFNAIPEESRYYDELPDIVDANGNILNVEWEYILGVDLGYSDAFAYSIWAYNNNYPTAYEIESFKETKLHEGKQADIIVELCKRFDFSKIVVDGMRATIESWRDRRGIMCEMAEKQHKHSYIAQLNAAMLSDKVCFRRGSALATEMASLQWKESTINSAKPKENKSKETPNDIADAALYAWKELINWAWEEVQTKLKHGSKEYYAKQEELDEEYACQTALGTDSDNYYDLFE